MPKRKWIIGILVLFCLQEITGVLFAESAAVLPKRRTFFDINNKTYFEINKRFDPDGNQEDIAVNYNGVIDSSFFPDLKLLEAVPAFAPFAPANLGEAKVDFTMNSRENDFVLAHGLTDKLQIGISWKYYWVKNKVKADMDNSNATWGKNGFTGSGFAPLVVPGTTPITTEDMQSILQGGLDINGDGDTNDPGEAGFGYRRFKTWQGEGMGDISLKLKYQYLKNDNWRLATKFTVTLPTGKLDDPDNLTDYRPYALGTQSYGIDLYNDFVGIKNNVFNLSLGYTYFYSDKQRLRVLNDVNQPLASETEKVKRQFGNAFRVGVSDSFTLFKGFSINASYDLSYREKTRISGNRGLNYKSLEDETRATSHIALVGASYSTVPLFLEKKFPVPFTAYIQYRDRFAGANNVFRSRYVRFGLTFYF